MDTPSSVFPLPRPRLRLFRRSPSPNTADATPQPAPSTVRSLFSAVHDDEDEFPTPRVHPRPISDVTPQSLPAETPAARLRALLAREPRSPRATTTSPPDPSSDAESAAGPARLGSSTSSVARDSLKGIFSRALREPGDTPEKGRPRRNSFDGSSMEITPVVGKDRGQRGRPSRRSLSDEEAEKPRPDRRADPSFRLSTALAFDTLRARLASSRSQLVDQNPLEALYDHSSLASTSTSNSRHQPQASSSVHVNPQASALARYPSFQMSSQLAFQSNLLERDSEMQRAMGDVLNSESEASESAPNAIQSAVIPSNSRPSSSFGRSRSNSKPEPRRASYELDSSATSPSVNGATGRKHHSQQEERDHQRAREWNRPRLPSTSSIAEMHHGHSQEFRSPSHTEPLSHEPVVSQSNAAKAVHTHPERRGSLASLRSLDDDHGSRPSSIGSQADYRDRTSELGHERNYEREREWNKPHPSSRPSSSLSSSSNHSFSHSHTHPPRSPSTTPYLTPTHASLQRKSSRASLRSESPASVASSRDSLPEREEGAKKEIVHQRERNWNSPRPHWSASKSPSPAHLRIRNNSLRTSSSLNHLRDSNGHEDASPAPAKPQSTTSKHADPSAAPPALLRKLDNRSSSGLEGSAIGTSPSARLKDPSPGKIPGAASKFGWNFARSPLPPLELDNSANRHRDTSSPTLGSRLSSEASEAAMTSQIPVRSRMKSFTSTDHATSDMSLTHIVGDELSFQKNHRNRLDGATDTHSRRKPQVARSSWSQEDVVLGSDEEAMVDLPQSTTPKSNPPVPVPEEAETDTETEVLTSPSARSSPQLGVSASIPNETSHPIVGNLPRAQTINRSLEESSAGATPPGTPPSAEPGSQLPASPSFSLVTPPRQKSFASSVLDFRTPSPPHGLPDLPAPPSSSDDDVLGDTPIKDQRTNGNPNFTLTKTPKPPGAWAATPLPSRYRPRSASPTGLFPLESTPPASTSTPLSRATSLPPTRSDSTIDNSGEDELLTPVVTLSRARSLPLRTPAPPGAWVATPAQSALLNNCVDQSQYGSLGRRKGLLKVRFDVAESETSATEGRPDSPLSAVRLANPNLSLPSPKLATEGAGDNAEVVNGAPQSTSTVFHRPATPERPTTLISRENDPSPRSLRKSPSVRLVDAYGRERVDEGGTEKPPIDLPNGHSDVEKIIPSPPTPRRSLVRIVDAMGREADDVMEIPDASEGRANGLFEADVSVVSDDTPIGHAEALARMRKTLRDLAESLSDTDRSEDLELNSSHLEQLEEVSRAARLARNQLAHNLHLETSKQHNLHHDNKSTPLSPLSTKKSWNTTIIFCGIVIQLLFMVAMWRYAHAEARHLFFTTYYDPLYPEFTPTQGNSCFSGTLSTSRSWTVLDSYETIRREGWWSVQKEIVRAMRHVGDRAWEWWGENVHLEKPT